MKLIVIDDVVVGTAPAGDRNGYLLIDPPTGWDGNLDGLVFDPVSRTVSQSIEVLQSQRIAAIKAEAAAAIEATDWRLQRAQEREGAGWASLEDVAAVLARREAVRRSSDAAEAAVMAMTDLAEIAAFEWSADDVAVPAPRLTTHEQLIRRFTEDEWLAMVTAARYNAAMDAWMQRFALADQVNLDDPATQAGFMALEMAGLLGPGRADEILGSGALNASADQG